MLGEVTVVENARSIVQTNADPDKRRTAPTAWPVPTGVCGEADPIFGLVGGSEFVDRVVAPHGSSSPSGGRQFDRLCQEGGGS
jgi:hypothetical protein